MFRAARKDRLAERERILERLDTDQASAPISKTKPMCQRGGKTPVISMHEGILTKLFCSRGTTPFLTQTP